MKKINQVLYQSGARWWNPEEHPMIRIANNYLKDVGFFYKDRIEVDYQRNKITITKIEKVVNQKTLS